VRGLRRELERGGDTVKRSALDEHIIGCTQCSKGPVLCTKGRAIAAVATRRVDARHPPAELDDDLTWLGRR
jgi:hypothetical protein